MSHGRVERFALDPVLNRPLGMPAAAVAGLEMRRLPPRVRDGRRPTARRWPIRNRHARGRDNARASYAEAPADAGAPLWEPLTRGPDRARRRRLRRAWCWPPRTGRGRPNAVLGRRRRLEPGRAVAGEPRLGPGGGDRARRRAGVRARGRRPPADVDLAEVDDTYAYKQLQHLDALGLAGPRPGAREPLAAARSARGTCTRPTASRARSRCVEQPARGRRHHGGRPSPGAGCPAARRRRRAADGGAERWPKRVAVIGAGMTKFVRRAQETGKELSWIAARAALDNARHHARPRSTPSAPAPRPTRSTACTARATTWPTGPARGASRTSARSWAAAPACSSPIQGWYTVASGMADVVLVRGRGEDVELPAAPAGRVPHDLRQHHRAPAGPEPAAGSSRWRCSATCRPTAWTSATSPPSP